MSLKKTLAGLAVIALASSLVGCKQNNDIKLGLADSESVRSAAGIVTPKLYNPDESGNYVEATDNVVKGVFKIEYDYSKDFNLEQLKSLNNIYEHISVSDVRRLDSDWHAASNRLAFRVRTKETPDPETYSDNAWGRFADGSISERTEYAYRRITPESETYVFYDQNNDLVQPTYGAAEYSISATYSKDGAGQVSGKTTSWTVTKAGDGYAVGRVLYQVVETYEDHPYFSEGVYKSSVSYYDGTSSTTPTLIGAQKITRSHNVSGTKETNVYAYQWGDASGTVGTLNVDIGDGSKALIDAGPKNNTFTKLYEGHSIAKVNQTFETDTSTNTRTTTYTYYSGADTMTKATVHEAHYTDVNDLNTITKLVTSQYQGNGISDSTLQSVTTTLYENMVPTEREVVDANGTVTEVSDYLFNENYSPLSVSFYSDAARTSPSKKMEYTYDENGYLASRLEWYYDASGNPDCGLQANSTTPYKYLYTNTINSDGGLTTVASRYACDSSGSAYTTYPVRKETKEFDSMGKLTRKLTQYFDNEGNSTSYSQVNYTNGAAGEQLTETGASGTTEADLSTPSDIIEYSYDSNYYRTQTKETDSSGNVNGGLSTCAVGAPCYKSLTYSY